MIMKNEPTMKTAAMFLTLVASTAFVDAKSISGKVTNAKGGAMEGVMVSAFTKDFDKIKTTSVFSQADGAFAIDGLRDRKYYVRARLMGQLDEWEKDVDAGATGLSFAMKPATGEDLEIQRTANSGFSMLKWDSMKDKDNYKMMCTYCHQTGSRGWRSPELPVDWNTMITRMDGFGGLYQHTQQTLVKRLVSTYSDEAVAKWSPFVPPPAPRGIETQARITEWDMGDKYKVMIHDIELGPDGLVYGVDMSRNAAVSLDPKTGERKVYRFPGKYRGPHSIELGNDGNMWFTLCISGEIAKLDLKTKKFTITSSAVAPARRGSYPHTLRINPKDPEGLIWYTDAGRNSCFSLHPKTLKVKEYKLLRKDQAVGAGKGESRGITPYGIDFSPVDGTIWYSKLNGNRIGRIDPKAPDGDIKEWNPPFRGPRRLHVAPDGMVWVPGFGSGVFGSFNPRTEKWKVYELPDAENQIPYALNIDPKGYVWICGTNSDSLHRFDPKTEERVEFRMPSRVTYTREIEFDEEGNLWTCNSNGPARHTERGFGSIIKLEIVGDELSGGK
jgi:streptogramin lyase